MKAWLVLVMGRLWRSEGAGLALAGRAHGRRTALATLAQGPKCTAWEPCLAMPECQLSSGSGTVVEGARFAPLRRRPVLLRLLRAAYRAPPAARCLPSWPWSPSMRKVPSPHKPRDAQSHSPAPSSLPRHTRYRGRRSALRSAHARCCVVVSSPVGRAAVLPCWHSPATRHSMAGLQCIMR